MRKIILSLLLFSNLSTVLSQENYKKCITTQLVKNEFIKNPDYSDIRNNDRKINNEKSENSTIFIPIVVHVIYRSSHANIGVGTNISNEQIEDQLRILNEDYSKMNPEFFNPPRNTFSNYWGNPNLQFCLATSDPNGNPTSGITRTETSQINWDADDASNQPCHEANGMKKTACGGRDGWDPSKYLNIWVCDLTNSQGNGMTLGYAYLPGLLADFVSTNDYKDGLVVDYRYFGTVGIAAPSSDGRTPTHEIGHYLGLLHTFCEDANGLCCDNDNIFFGGYVDDTPACKDIYFGSVNSGTNNNTCNDLSYSNVFSSDVLDMDENFMSYASNTWMFSQGQVDAMLSTLNQPDWQGGRLNLKNSNVTVNCTGIINSSQNYNLEINVRLYPNPTDGNLSINTSEKIINIAVYNIIGEKIVCNTKLKNNKIDISSLNDGIYFIETITQKGKITKKIILRK